MNTARIVVLSVALVAGGIAAYLASGADNKPAPSEPVAQLPTVDVLVAKSEIGLGQTVKPEDLQWQTWSAATASATFIQGDQRSGGTDAVTSEIVLSNIRGLAIDQAPKEKDGQNAVLGKTVTLELRPEQAETLAHAHHTEDQMQRRGENIAIIRYGVLSQMTAQKWI